MHNRIQNFGGEASWGMSALKNEIKMDLKGVGCEVDGTNSGLCNFPHSF